jgi:transcriptional regulator with XRE-family HTH domain
MASNSQAEAMRLSDPLRAYISALRDARGMTQPEVGIAAGIKPRTYISWETGEVAKIDAEVLRLVVRAVGGLWEHLDRVMDMAPAEARALALSWAALSPEEQEKAKSAVTKLERIVALSADDPLKLDDVLRRVRDAARDNPDVLQLISGYLAGVSAVLPRQKE